MEVDIWYETNGKDSQICLSSDTVEAWMLCDEREIGEHCGHIVNDLLTVYTAEDSFKVHADHYAPDSKDVRQMGWYILFKVVGLLMIFPAVKSS